MMSEAVREPELHKACQLSSPAAVQVNKLLLGIPTVVKLHGFTLNTSLAGQPEVTADHLRVQVRYRLKAALCLS